MNYRSVTIEEGKATEPIQYVGVYTLNWKREWGPPERGFVELESYESESDLMGELKD